MNSLITGIQLGTESPLQQMQEDDMAKKVKCPCGAKSKKSEWKKVGENQWRCPACQKICEDDEKEMK